MAVVGVDLANVQRAVAPTAPAQNAFYATVAGDYARALLGLVAQLAVGLLDRRVLVSPAAG